MKKFLYILSIMSCFTLYAKEVTITINDYDTINDYNNTKLFIFISIVLFILIYTVFYLINSYKFVVATIFITFIVFNFMENTEESKNPINKVESISQYKKNEKEIKTDTIYHTKENLVSVDTLQTKNETNVDQILTTINKYSTLVLCISIILLIVTYILSLIIRPR